jgi:hypothetical protein
MAKERPESPNLTPVVENDLDMKEIVVPIDSHSMQPVEANNHRIDMEMVLGSGLLS